MQKQDFIFKKLEIFQDLSNESRLLCSEVLQIQASTFDEFELHFEIIQPSFYIN